MSQFKDENVSVASVNHLKMHKEIIIYGIVGVLNTALNFFLYFFLESMLNVYYLYANFISWIACVIFSFYANKVYVFQIKNSNIKEFCKEVGTFLLCSLGTGFLDIFILWCMVDIMTIDETISKFVDVFVVIVVNYFLRKFFVFKKIV